ncbi:MAG: hypothetical protein JO100_14745 [Pseudonocardia sp.]|nr:hypothetical protein [Pseudonocardia sp.]
MDKTFRLAELISLDDPSPGLAAVRVLGADTLAPYRIAKRPIGSQDAEIVTASLVAFPTTDSAALPVRLQDWATRRLLAGPTGRPAPKFPAVPGLSAGLDWPGLAAVLGPLAPLAIPGLDCPVHDMARGRPLDLARGVTRSLLRRDYSTAARLARWFAIGPSVAAVPVESVLTHLALFAGDDPRIGLDIALARWAVRDGRA